METLHGIVKLRLDQYNELLENGSITYGGKTLVYDPYILYFTDEDVTAQLTGGLEKIAQLEEGITNTLLNTNNTTSQAVNAEETIIGNKINLHKVAKTGLYTDIIGAPAFAEANEVTSKETAEGITNKVISPATLYAALASQTLGNVSNLFVFKGAVATEDALPQSGNAVGHVYYVKENSSCYVWIEDDTGNLKWEEFGPTIDVTEYGIATSKTTGLVKSSDADLQVKVDSATGIMTINGIENVIIERIASEEFNRMSKDTELSARLNMLTNNTGDSTTAPSEIKIGNVTIKYDSDTDTLTIQ